jgi:undecaprenyl diphosphate synthase
MIDVLLDGIKTSNLKVPGHVAIIMDGNGRWANGFSKPRVWGHHKGARSVRKTIEACRTIGVKYLTLYAFSDENWSRPKYEVDTIMDLLFRYLRKEESNLNKNNIKLQIVGDMERLPEKTRNQLRSTMEVLNDNDGMTLILALSYGAKNEIISATKSLATKVKNGEIEVEQITTGLFEQFLWTSDVPDPDLLIRTSGEQRLSNFLLWQLAYSEFYFTKVCWPDFNEYELLLAIESFNHRDRRYGNVVESRPLSIDEVKELSGEEL